ncbi:uncharacterized protein [Miscanthus floridulus]|uniref:uncharacterized protein isoform X2 n=1 Tax=Miscanthus floridulus TaxID=154761 RepID=UPI00345933E3
MASEDCDGLPMYIEEDEEEAAAEKQKHQQQSQKPPFKHPWEIITQEEKARREFNFAMMDKLFEFDPKTGSGSYTQVWFVNFITFNLDDENSLIRDDHKLTDSLNVLCLKIRSSDVGYPINVYGTVIVRDRLDMKCNIFQRNRSNRQLVESEGESLILTGPTRGIVLKTDAYFEINLKITQDRESEDRQFSKTLIDVNSARINYRVKTQTTVSWLSAVDLMFSYVKKALEGTMEIRILSGSSSFYGRVTVCTADIPSHILLYDSDVHGANTMGND